MFHACNVNKDGKLQPVQIVVSDKKKNKKSHMEPSEVFERMLSVACQRYPLKRCTEVYRLVKMYSFDCPICQHAHSNVRLNELSVNRLHCKCLQSNYIHSPL